MDVLHAADHLLEKLASLCFLQLFALDDVVEQLAPARVLHDQEQLPRSFDNLSKSHSRQQALVN